MEVLHNCGPHMEQVRFCIQQAWLWNAVFWLNRAHGPSFMIQKRYQPTAAYSNESVGNMKFSLLTAFVLSTVSVDVYAQDGVFCGGPAGQSRSSYQRVTN